MENPQLKYTHRDGFMKDFDSIRVFFSFAGENMPMFISIETHSNTAVYLDWNMSAFIMNRVLMPVIDPDSRIDIASPSVEYLIRTSKNNALEQMK